MIVDAIKKTFNNFCFSQTGDSFVRVMNFRALITNSDALFKYDSREQTYTLSSRNVSETRSLSFKYELQGGQTYFKGIHHRGEEIGEKYLLKYIDFVDGDVVLDCGANLGDLLLWFQNRSLNILYTGFEPSPEEFKCLKDNIGEQQAKQLALWNESKILDFYINSQTADSSLIEPVSYKDILKVQALTLNSFLDTNIKLLKLEAEGGELEVLEGAGDKINRIEYIAADVGPERGVNQESTLNPVSDFLESKNFTLIHSNPKKFTVLFKNNAPCF